MAKPTGTDLVKMEEFRQILPQKVSDKFLTKLIEKEYDSLNVQDIADMTQEYKTSPYHIVKWDERPDASLDTIGAILEMREELIGVSFETFWRLLEVCKNDVAFFEQICAALYPVVSKIVERNTYVSSVRGMILVNGMMKKFCDIVENHMDDCIEKAFDLLTNDETTFIQMMLRKADLLDFEGPCVEDKFN